MSATPKFPEKAIRSRRSLLESYSDVVDGLYKSSLLGQLLYTLVRFDHPRAVLELGTGVGVTSLNIALALEENGKGHLWTLDEGWRLQEKLGGAAEELRRHSLLPDPVEKELNIEYVERLGRLLEVDSRISFIHEKFTFNTDSNESWTIPNEKFGLILMDFDHSAEMIVRVFRTIMSRVTAVCWIVIDSASTWLPSYSLLHDLVSSLDRGIVPLTIGRGDPRLDDFARRHTYQLLNLPMVGRDECQNGPALIRILPRDVIPWPPAVLRSPNDVDMAWYK